MSEGLHLAGFPRLFRRSAYLGGLLLLAACAEPAAQSDASAAASVGSTSVSSAATAASNEVTVSATQTASAASSSHAEHAGHSASTPAASDPSSQTAGGEALPLEVVSASVTAVPPSLTDTAAYVTLRNLGKEDVVLVGASSPAVSHVMLMQTVNSGENGASMSGMVEVPSLTVPAGGELTMASGGNHLMLMGLTQPLKEGESIPFTLEAESGGTLEVSAEVARP